MQCFIFRPEIIETGITFSHQNVSSHLFWQGPAFTEALAARSLIKAGYPPLPTSFQANVKDICFYFAYPWATVIDQKCIENASVDFCGWSRFFTFPSDTRIHTVCQHIHWARLLPIMQEIGVTDLHLSHFTQASFDLAARYGITAYSFPLIAAAFWDPINCKVVGPVTPPLRNRKWFSSFTGAYMPHYRSDTRLKIRDSFDRAGKENDYFRLNSLWFYNEVVYEFQAESKATPLSSLDNIFHGQKKFRDLLSQTIFSLCPEGAGPNTLRFWESLQSGCIPVIYTNDWVPPRLRNFDLSDVSVTIRTEDAEYTHEILREHWLSIESNLDNLSRRIRTVAKQFRDLKVFS